MLISRRKLLHILSMTAVSASFGSSVVFASSDDSIELNRVNHDSDLLLVFSSLCKLLTANSSLEDALIKKYFKVFQNEPYVEHHIRSTYSALLAELLKNDVIESTSTSFLDGAELWFFQHLQTTLYTGVYYYEGVKPKRVSLERAIIFESLSNIYAKPYTGFTGFSGWASNPRQGEG